MNDTCNIEANGQYDDKANKLQKELVKEGIMAVKSEEITPMDVLFGNGNENSRHEGNKKYQALVQKYAPKYASAGLGSKINVAKQVVAAVHAKEGRFLKQDTTTGSWFEVRNQKALAKKAAEAMGKVNAKKPRALTKIHESSIRNTDVLCGNSYHYRKGNKTYQALVQEHADEYASVGREFKTTIAEKVVAAVHAEEGRFLKWAKTTGSWFEIDDKAALEKARRALARAFSSKVNNVHCIPKDAITDADVLTYEKGALDCNYDHHEGNKKFQELVLANVQEFATRGADVPRKIVDDVVGRSGRFLRQKVGHDGVLFEVLDNKQVMRKVYDALLFRSKKS